MRERVVYLARGIAKALQWDVEKGAEWDRTGAVYSVNTVCGY